MSEQKAAIERNGEATLLVVDDEPEIVALLDEYFTGLGYRVLTAEDGATALKRAEQSPDLIVLDVGMPLMDGYAVCRRLREHLTCPILFLTARVEDIDAKTLEYLTAMEFAPQLKASGLDGDYRILADFGGTVLAGAPSKYGVQFVTWDWDYHTLGN